MNAELRKYQRIKLVCATLYQGNSLKVLPLLEPEQFTACVCDPPYHLTQASRKGSPRTNDPKTPFGRTRLGSKGFMGKTWDGGDVAFRPEFWAEVLRVLKPGAMLLAFGGTRTFHRLTCAIEDAGFEVRDCLMWLYGSGLPKSLDISKALDKTAGAETAQRWDGWGTSLKPAWESVVLAMRPLDGTFAQNAEKHGVAGLNIDGSRIGVGKGGCRDGEKTAEERYADRGSTNFAPTPGPRGGNAKGRWPANLLFDEEAAVMLDRQSGVLTSGRMPAGTVRQNRSAFTGQIPTVTTRDTPGDSGGASRFFYCSKANRRDRTCDGRIENNHPTVKPRSLMEYLCRLVTPPGGGVILDPFMGSGSTGIGALLTGNRFVGIELEPESFETARQRIETVSPSISNNRNTSQTMRRPQHLSYSSLSLWERDREEFFIRYLSDTKAPRLPQEKYMSIGSAFDAYAKSALHEAIFGRGADPQFEFDRIFTDQVEEHNRDWAREHGRYVFDCYVHTGAYAELLAMLLNSREEPRFEFTVKGVIGDRVPFLGKPDCRFVHECGVHVILDWKVKGYCSKYGASPSKNYMICRDGYDAVKLGVGATVKNPEGKQSASHGKAHRNFEPYDHHGMRIHAGSMEYSNPEYADQLSIYGWLLGEKPGDENVVVCVDEIVSKYMGEGNKPLLRVAQHAARVQRDHQLRLLDRATSCWDAITSGHIFSDLSREDSDARCEVLSEVSVGLHSNGSSKEDWFAEVVRPQFAR